MAFFILFFVLGASALDNGLGRTPQQGYNSWYDVLMEPSEAHVRATVDAMVRQGLVAAGYRYLNLDDGIVMEKRDALGNLQADTTAFPNGFKAVADYVHANGMLFGVYTDRGTQTCGGRAGAQGFESKDATWYASQGVDYLKEDSCAASEDHQESFAQYAKMRDALNATGRPIFFSLCGWEAWYAPMCHILGNSCRIGPDDTNWAGALKNMDDMEALSKFSGPGGWTDPCLLLGRDAKGNEAVTDNQGRAQFSMWAIMASPLLLSNNVRNLTSFQLETYLNREVIAVNQDVLGRPGSRLVGGQLAKSQAFATDLRANIWGRPLADGSWALTFINADEASAELFCGSDCLAATGWEPEQVLSVRDLWLRKDLSPTTVTKGLKVQLEPEGGVAMLRVKPLWSDVGTTFI